MIKTFNCKNPYTFLNQNYKNKELTLIAIIGKNSDPKQVATYLKKYLDKTGGQVIILSKISFIKTVGVEEKNKNIRVIEHLAPAFAKAGKKVNVVRAASILENKNSIVSNLIYKGKLGKKFIINNPKNNYYLVSKNDVLRALQLVSSTNVKGEVFNISLNKLTINDLITRVSKYYNLRSEINGEEVLNEKIVDKDKLSIINFKIETTIEDYLKSKAIQKPLQTKKNKKRRLKNYTYAIKPILAAVLFIIFLFAIDFATDNYLLQKNLKSFNTRQSMYYANKLRNIYLPGKVGKNYTNTYNAIYYGLNAYETYNSSKNAPVESIKTFSNKAYEYLLKTNKDLYITNKEKEYYDKYKPVALKLFEKIEYTELLKLKPFLESEKNILVLIQNGNELRPTGGFIGSYALIKTKDMQVLDYKFDDIYNIDGTIEEKYSELLIETPKTYKDFLNTKGLPARDINLILNSDLRNKTILSYFETTLDTKIDAIVYLNTDSTKTLLNLTGPIYLGTYNTEVNSENVDILAQTYSEENYYEGSSQKKNFLNVLGARTIAEVADNKVQFNTDTLNQLLLALDNKEALLYIKDNPYKEVINTLNLDEEIKNPNESSDYLYIIESNLGENKVNKLTEKNVEYNLTYDARRGLKLINLKVDLLNQADTYSWPYGDYKGVVSIALQKNVEIAKAEIITPKPSGGESTVDITKSIEILGLNNIKILNIPFLVKPRNKATIKLSLEELDKDYLEHQNYETFIQKQPGAKPYNLIYNFNIPSIKQDTKSIKIVKDTNISF